MRKYLQPRKLVGNLLVLALLGLWFLTLAPTTVGGKAGYTEVSGHSMDGTYRTGDLIVTRAQDTYEVGDIVVFRASGGQVIHRIISGNGTKGYTTQGDNNPDPDPWHPTDGDVLGKSWIRLEGKAWIAHLPDNPRFVGIAAGMFTLVVLGLDAIPRRRKDDADETGPGVVTEGPDAEKLVGAAK